MMDAWIAWHGQLDWGAVRFRCAHEYPQQPDSDVWRFLNSWRMVSSPAALKAICWKPIGYDASCCCKWDNGAGIFWVSKCCTPTLRYFASFVFIIPHKLLKSSQLYILKDDKLGNWPTVTNNSLETGRFQVVSWKVALKMMEVLWVTRLQVPILRRWGLTRTKTMWLEVSYSSELTAVRETFYHDGVNSFEVVASARRTSMKRLFSTSDVTCCLQLC